jgi:hypothetical protein
MAARQEGGVCVTSSDFLPLPAPSSFFALATLSSRILARRSAAPASLAANAAYHTISHHIVWMVSVRSVRMG